MRDALTLFGNIAITSSATAAGSAVGSANIVNMTEKGKTMVTPKDCRLVIYPKSTASGSFTFQIKGSDNVTGTGSSVALSSAAVVDTITVDGITAGKKHVYPFPLEVTHKYYQIFGFGAGAANVEAWFEFGA